MQNVSLGDKIIRLSIGMILISYALFEQIYIPAIVGVVLILTGSFRWCLPYAIFGWKTKNHAMYTDKSLVKSFFEGLAYTLVIYLLVMIFYLVSLYIELL